MNENIQHPIVLVCGSFHKEEITTMLNFAHAEAAARGLTIESVVWVPGSMEVPLALKRALERPEVIGAACFGIIERGETFHGEAMGHAVTRAVIDLQLKYDKPIGLGIIGPGAEPHHIPPRLEPHARAAIAAIDAMYER